MRVLFPKMKYQEFIQCMKDERFLSMTVLVCNTCYFEITQKHALMSRKIGFKPHKGDIIKLMKKDEGPQADDENREGSIEGDDDNSESSEEANAYIRQPSPPQSASRASSRPKVRLGSNLENLQPTDRLTELDEEHENSSLPKAGAHSSTHYTDGRGLASRHLSGKREFSIRRHPLNSENSKRSALDGIANRLKEEDEASNPRLISQKQGSVYGSLSKTRMTSANNNFAVRSKSSRAFQPNRLIRPQTSEAGPKKTASNAHFRPQLPRPVSTKQPLIEDDEMY